MEKLFFFVIGFLSNKTYEEWSRNRQKFENEYSELLVQLKKIEKSITAIRFLSKGNPYAPIALYGVEEGLKTPRRDIDALITENPKRIENRLVEDWKKISDSVHQLILEYESKKLQSEGFHEEELYTKREEALKKIKRLNDKVENFYACHFHRRLLYRLKSRFGSKK